jgi:chromosome segregation ATPase
LNTRIAELEGQLAASTDTQQPLNARIAELEGQLAASTDTQQPLNTRIAELERRLHAALTEIADLNAGSREAEAENARQAEQARAEQTPQETQPDGLRCFAANGGYHGVCDCDEGMIKMGGPCVLDNPESRRAEDARQRALRQVREECDREAKRDENIGFGTGFSLHACRKEKMNNLGFDTTEPGWHF